jgi:hypothetical protein
MRGEKFCPAIKRFGMKQRDVTRLKYSAMRLPLPITQITRHFPCFTRVQRLFIHFPYLLFSALTPEITGSNEPESLC